MDGQIPIIIVISPEGRRTRLRMDPPETPKPPVIHRPSPSPITPEEREIIFAGTQPVPPRSIFNEILVRLGDILCL
jgi:hypothetical protein